MKLKRILFFNDISTIFQNFSKTLKTNNFKRIIIAHKEALESLLHKICVHKKLNYNIQIVKFILPTLKGRTLFAFTKLSIKTRLFAFWLLIQIKQGFIKFLLFPYFLACACLCHGGILSLEDLAIEKIISLLPKNKFTDIPNIPLSMNKLVAIKIEGKALDKWVSIDEESPYSIIDKKHKFLFNTKLNMHFKNNSNLESKKKLIEISNHPYFPERYEKDSCDDELGFKPFIHNYGHFFPYIKKINSNYNQDSDSESDYEDSGSQYDDGVGCYEALGVYFAYIGSQKYPSCLVINVRDTIIDDPCDYNDLLTYSDVYSITEFNNMPWGKLTFESPNVRPAYENTYGYNIYGFNCDLEELGTRMDEAFANEVSMMKPKWLFSSESEYQAELARRIQWEKVKREEEQKKELASLIASKKICNEIRLAVFKIIKGIPLPKAYVDKIDYTGTFELKVVSQ